MADQPYKRVMLKLSGEMLVGDQAMGIQPATIGRFADEIKDVHSTGVQIALVIGGGNIFRGLAGASRGWTALMRTTWACSRRSSTPSHSRMHSRRVVSTLA